MTRKDYTLIAKAVKEMNDRAWNMHTAHDRVVARMVVSGLAHELATELDNTNPNFDRGGFLKACGVAGGDEGVRLSATVSVRHYD